MSHLNGEGGRHRRDLPPLGRPAAPTGVEIADVDRPGHHEITAACATDLALPGADRNAGLATRRRHVEAVVVPADRLFEPANIEISGEARELDRLAQRPALIGVDDQDEIVADRLAGDAHALGVLSRRAAADLELAAGVAFRLDAFHLAAGIGERLARRVVTCDANREEAIGVAAPESIERRIERLPHCIPKRAVNASLSAHGELAVA